MNLNRPWVDFGHSFTHSNKRFINPARRKEHFTTSYTKLLLTLMAYDIPIYIIDTNSYERANMYANFPFLKKYKKCKAFMPANFYEEAAKILCSFNQPVNITTSKVNVVISTLLSMMLDVNRNTKTCLYLQMNWCTCNYFDAYSLKSYNKYKEDQESGSYRTNERLLKYEFD